MKKRKEAQEAYRHKARKFTLQFSLADTGAREWFEQQQPDKGKYLKELILNDKKEKGGRLNDG